MLFTVTNINQYNLDILPSVGIWGYNGLHLPWYSSQNLKAWNTSEPQTCGLLNVTFVPIKSSICMCLSFWASCQSPIGPSDSFPGQRLAHSMKEARAEWHGNSVCLPSFLRPGHTQERVMFLCHSRVSRSSCLGWRLLAGVVVRERAYR